MRRLLGSLVVLSALLLPVGASAQTSWLADRGRAEGPGFRVGDFELHPGIGAEIGWDSNLYYTEDDGSSGAHAIDTGILRITPHFLFSTISEQRRQEGEARDDAAVSALPMVAFRGGISAAYYEFFAAPERRNVDLMGSLRLQVLPGRPFSFSLWDEFSRGVRPFTENGAQSQARIRNQAGLDLAFQTDGGVVQVTAGYAFNLDFFEDSIFQYGNSFDHRITLRESFRFLPQTALIHDTVVDVHDYYSRTSVAPTLLLNNARLRSRLGINGAITNEIGVMAMVGYGAGFFEGSVVDGVPYDQDYESIVAQVELRWDIMEGMQLAIGYDRDFFPSFVGNYYSRDRGYMRFQTLVGGAFLLALDFDAAYMDFGLIRGGTPGRGIIDASAGERDDVRIGAGLFGEYRFTDWLAVNATLRYSGQLTDYRFTSAMGVLDPAQYNKFEVFGGVRVFY